MPFPGMRTGYKSPKPTNPLQGIIDWAVNFTGPTPGVPYGRSAAAEEVPAPTQRQGPTRDIYEQPGVGYFDRTSGRFLGGAPAAPQLPPPGQGTTTIVRGTRDGVTPDRTQSDEYRAQLAQYGALSKAGKQEEAEKLGMEIWQQKYGKTPMGQPGGAVGAFNPLMQKTFGYQKGASVTEPSYAGSTVQPMGSEDFAVAANAVPAPWNQQGAKVSADFSGVVPFQASKTTGEGMPAFQTTGEKAEEFLRNTKIRTLF